MRPVAGGNVAIVDPGPLRLVVEAERVLVAHWMRRAMGKGHGVTSQGPSQRHRLRLLYSRLSMRQPARLPQDSQAGMIL